MAGTIIDQGHGTWRVSVSMGIDADGKRRRYTETVHGRKSVAQRRARELVTQKDNGSLAPNTKLTLAEHLRNWLNGYARTRCGPRTIEGYETIIERHLIPGLGHYQLRQLNAGMIQAYYSRAIEAPLSARSVAKHHRLLSQALKYAVRQEILARNPCDMLDAPKWQPRTMRALDENEARVFLQAASSSRYYGAYFTAIYTGLRQAELLGLRWRDIDLDNEEPTLSVNQVLLKRKGVCDTRVPKTPQSRRRVSLTRNLTAYLRNYRGEKEDLCLDLELGRLLSPDDFVFADVNGQPLDPSALSHDFARIAREVGLADVRFHDLRHTFASLMLMQGAPAKVVSEALGHASVSFTLQTYSHVLPGMQGRAMELLNAVLPEAIGTKLVQ